MKQKNSWGNLEKTGTKYNQVVQIFINFLFIQVEHFTVDARHPSNLDSISRMVQ